MRDSSVYYPHGTTPVDIALTPHNLEIARVLAQAAQLGFPRRQDPSYWMRPKTDEMGQVFARYEIRNGLQGWYWWTGKPNEVILIKDADHARTLVEELHR